MDKQTATDRARMPAGHNPVLERRSVETANRNLLKHLRPGHARPGLSVLDVGCGTGAITRSIARHTGPTGRVLGIDPNPALIGQAVAGAQELPGLVFETADIFTFATDERFDLVSCARTLQWLTDPRQALARMKALAKPGGWLSVLDFNHEKLRWTPDPPPAMAHFYRAFLQWRQDAGFDNAIADHLADLMSEVVGADVKMEDQSETTRRGDPDFGVESRLWAEVAELRGPQLVEAGYLTETERLRAIADYDHWIATVGESMTVYLLAADVCVTT